MSMLGAAQCKQTQRSPSEKLSSLTHPRSLLVPQPFSFLIGPGALAKIFLNLPQCGFLQFPFICCFLSFSFFNSPKSQINTLFLIFLFPAHPNLLSIPQFHFQYNIYAEISLCKVSTNHPRPLQPLPTWRGSVPALRQQLAGGARGHRGGPTRRRGC